MLKAGVWYLVARQGRELRTFKLAAIQTLERLAEPFVRPRRFDLVAYWAEATRRFEESVYRGVATLRVSPAGLAGCAASARSSPTPPTAPPARPMRAAGAG